MYVQEGLRRPFISERAERKPLRSPAELPEQGCLALKALLNGKAKSIVRECIRQAMVGENVATAR